MHDSEVDFTIGITTCWGKDQLIKSIKSIRESKNISQDFRIIVAADGPKISDKIKTELKKLNVELLENPAPHSIAYKQKQITKEVKTNYIIFSQDDIIFNPHTLSKIIAGLKKSPDIALLGIKNEPLPGRTIFENIVNVGTNLNNYLAKTWNNGDNYLAMTGRVTVLKADCFKKMELDDEVVSDDAYMYLKNKQLNNLFKYQYDNEIYFRNPTNLKEFIRKSHRFQNTKHEFTSKQYLKNVTSEFNIPFSLQVLAGLNELAKNPICFVCYLFIFIYSRLLPKNKKEVVATNWQVDISTKYI